MNLTHVAPLLSKAGVWAPMTATLDWCEINHQFSPYVAEMANTMSNLVTILLSLVGIMDTIKQGLPHRFTFGYVGMLLVGIGSFVFHATLLFEAQLADELPMIYVGSLFLFTLFDTHGKFGLQSTRSKALAVLVLLLSSLFSWSYIVYPEPVYHQAVFASIMVTLVARVAYLIRATEAGRLTPPETRRVITSIFGMGTLMFAFGFLLWNMDNIFCYRLTEWKLFIGWPAAFVLEGHAWWHVLTASGTYCMLVGIHFTTICVKEGHQGYLVVYDYGLPFVRRRDTKMRLE